MRKLMTTLAAGAALTGVILAAVPARATVHAATPAQRTCAAFAAWQHNQTTANLGRLVIASAGLPRSYLKADVGQLYADASSPSAKAAKYAAKDLGYVAGDCAK